MASPRGYKPGPVQFSRFNKTIHNYLYYYYSYAVMPALGRAGTATAKYIVKTVLRACGGLKPGEKPISTSIKTVLLIPSCTLEGTPGLAIGLTGSMPWLRFPFPGLPLF